MIKYKSGYKYILWQDYEVQTNIYPDVDLVSHGGYIELLANGVLTIKKGYAWDGPSGPAVDTPTFMRGSLVHDACYQLMREGMRIDFRDEADELMRQVCIEDGMSKLRAWWCFKAVRTFAKRSATKQGIRPVITAP